MTPETASGSCLCGAVAFTAPMPPRWVAHCHCTRCQRAHGAAFVTWVGVDADRVVTTDPQGLLHWFEPAADASPDAGGHRASCSHCGSPMFFRSPRWPGELHIVRALFTQPVAHEPDAHAYYDTHVAWVELGDDLPRTPPPASAG